MTGMHVKGNLSLETLRYSLLQQGHWLHNGRGHTWYTSSVCGLSFHMLHRIGSVSYFGDMHDTWKCEQTFHVNMLKKWNTPYGNLWTKEEEIPEWRGDSDSDSKVGDQLWEHNGDNCRLSLVMSWATTLDTQLWWNIKWPPQAPGQLDCHLTDSLVHKEVQEMLDAGIIEPSCSKWHLQFY